MTGTLREDLDTLWRYGAIPTGLPEYIAANLNANLPLRPYQIEALCRLLYYLNGFPQRPNPAQLLFHMATGSGKTLIMAAAILFLYEKGYRNFIFFVNSTNIIEKTRENFLNPLFTKYLFADRLKFGHREVRIREADNFQAGDETDIRILFTTIQGLHVRLNEPRENALTYDDFAERDVILISDEAHHINALTKGKLSQSEAEALNTWEATVDRIFHSRSRNLLLEFTATIELDHPAVAEKYADKIIYQYDLKKFRADGYSKEVRVLPADLSPSDRALQAVVVSQYRRKVAAKHGIPLKPVILMKSARIADSVQHVDDFHSRIAQLTSAELVKIRDGAEPGKIVADAFAYLKRHDISLENFILEIQEEFNLERCLSINSKSDSEEKQLLVNTLEDDGNEIRVVFAVDKLNEGWDVLNLFDIVRLYDTRDAKKGVPGRTTISEAQLIGRGARYYPFRIDAAQPRDQRKYDDDLNNELRVLEELHYHSAHNPKYISELHMALVQTGIVSGQAREIDLRLKDDFKVTEHWRNGVIFANKRIRSDRGDVFGLAEFSIKGRYACVLRTGRGSEADLLEPGLPAAPETVSRTILMTELGLTVVRKALSKLDFYRFDHLKRFVPNLKSISEFISADEYLGSVSIEIHGTEAQLENLSPDDRLSVALTVLQKLSREITGGSTEFIGTKRFEPLPLQYTLSDRKLLIAVREGGDQEFGVGMRETTNAQLQLNLADKAWYVFDENYGTSEEKHFVKFIHNNMLKLQKRFQDIYLIRNERFFKIYRFSDGAAIEPDFVLFATEKNSGKSVIYQLFVEPKGEHLIQPDKWKQDFLLEIEGQAEVQVIAQNREFRLIGMPFYNETATKREFEAKLWGIK